MSQHAGSGWFLVPTLSSGVGKRLDQAPSEGPLELAVGVEPELQEPGRLRQRRGAPKQLYKIVPRRSHYFASRHAARYLREVRRLLPASDSARTSHGMPCFPIEWR